MAQLDRLLQRMLEHPDAELRLRTGLKPCLVIQEQVEVIVDRALTAAEIRFLLGEILNEEALSLLESRDELRFGYTARLLSRVMVHVADWHLDTRATFRGEAMTSEFPHLLTSPFPQAAVVLEPRAPRAPKLAEEPGAHAESEAKRTDPAPPPLSLEALLLQLVSEGGSDLHLSSEHVPRMRVQGAVRPLSGVAELSSQEVSRLIEPLLTPRVREQFEGEHDTDLAWEMPKVGRFRLNLFRDRLGPGLVARVIPERMPKLDELGLPEAVKSLAELKKGLVLVTGPTGSGKSTTLAALIDAINREREEHIITLEDPIEFVHHSQRCLVNQREVGVHTTAFKRALRAALREDPDVLLIGELRDLETAAIAIETAETGHLVFGTLHTNTAASTVDRLIDQFPGERQEQIRVMLAEGLKAVLSQTLCRRLDGGRVAAHELLLVTPAVSSLIREGKTHQIASAMQTSKGMGMRTLNDSLAELVRGAVIAKDEAMVRSPDRAALARLL